MEAFEATRSPGRLASIVAGWCPEVRARLNHGIDTALDRTHLEALLAERALSAEALDMSKVAAVREEMERGSARRLQPHFISSLFFEALARLGGKTREREPGRHQLTHVPSVIRTRARELGLRPVVLPNYERITFDKGLIRPRGLPLAEFTCSGHPLLDATIDITLERHRDLLRQGAVLIDETDLGTGPGVLVMLEHTITDARVTREGQPRITSRRLAFVELTANGEARPAGPTGEQARLVAPHRHASQLLLALSESIRPRSTSALA